LFVITIVFTILYLGERVSL